MNAIKSSIPNPINDSNFCGLLGSGKSLAAGLRKKNWGGHLSQMSPIFLESFVFRIYNWYIDIRTLN